MARLVFDIETAALSEQAFDEAQRNYLFRDALKLADEAARQGRRAEIQEQLSLWPFTAQIVCIAMLNADTMGGQVLYLADDLAPEVPPAAGATVRFMPFPSEKMLLLEFWEVAKKYESIVTFNGRGFDVPFIYLRSALTDVAISRKDWLGYRYQTDPHCDLAEQFTFYGVSGREGAARRFNLDFYCKAFGVESPKSHGISGLDVKALMLTGQYLKIAEYCLRDVEATLHLYRIWKERLAGIS